MKTSLFALAVFAGLSSHALAGEINATSRIDEVTVYPAGADVTRLAEVEVPGDDSTVLLDDLPQSADPQSVRVEGMAEGDVAITSVDSRFVRASAEEGDARRKALTARIEALQDERAALDQLMADKQAERNLLLGLAQRAGEGKGDAAKPLDAAGLDALVGTVATRMAESSKAIQDGRLRQRAIDKEVAEFSAQLNEQSPEAGAHLSVKLHVHAADKAKAQFKVTYRVPDAGWHAFYDAHLSLPSAGHEASFSLLRQAEVAQRSGESWNNVKLTLSTAKAAAAAEAPVLDESEIAVLRPEPILERKAAKAGSLALDKAEAEMQAAGNALKEKDADLPAAAPVAQPGATLQQAGFTAQYVIASRSDIDTLGTAKTVRIGSAELPARLSVAAVPRLDGNAYLAAGFTAPADAPLLAGPVHLFRGAAYVGQAAMPELAGGEEAQLGFGVDDLVKVKRAEVKRLSAEEGLLSTSNTREMGWVITVTNLHDVKMPIRILDRKPFASDAQIVVSDRADSTPPSATDVDHKRGVMAWDLALEPRAEAQIRTGYKISAPKDLQVGLVD